MEIDTLLQVNAAHQPSAGVDRSQPRPSRRLAIVTCMDVRIDLFGALGLGLGEAHIVRNAGGRVTDDVLRSLALSVQILGVDTVVVMQHTRCGLAGVTDDDLRRRTGYPGEFLAITDHETELRNDVDTLAGLPFLEGVATIAGWLYDIETDKVTAVERRQRPPRTAGSR